MALWEKIATRGNVEDRRGMASAVGGLSLTGVAVLFIINALMGGDPVDMLNQLQQVPIQGQQGYDRSDFEGDDEYEIFAEKVLGSNNEMWSYVFSQLGRPYHPPKLVLFRGITESGCGNASSAVGPHYCPLDKTIYLDETFFNELTRRFGTQGGDVAEAYVISHEAAHHAQNELDLLNNSSLARKVESENELSIKQELQADCFAGLWANSIKDLGVFMPGEIKEAMDAARAVGDDRVQEKVTGRINPENWTHGSSEDRMFWFNKGYETGDLGSCDTYQ